MSDEHPGYEQFVDDLGAHAGTKCKTAVMDAIALVDNDEQAAQVAMLALAAVAGIAGYAFARSNNAGSTEDEKVRWTCAVLDVAKDIVTKGPDAIRAEMASRRRSNGKADRAARRQAKANAGGTA